ncbi:MAG TPA: DUF3828 domain-containing protein [Xanthobacteraceae bacterium]|jgi:hypothetical protein|nr:DUF3828 domain-containing protein [Xanthobacteraceae bacterium]
MPTRRDIFLLAIACTAFVSPVQADDRTPLAFVTAIYETYEKPDSDGALIDDVMKLRRYFEPRLAAVMDKDQEIAAKHHEVGKLDFDPFIDAQDWEFKTFDVAIKDTAPGKVSATITFTNLGKPTTIVLDLIAIKNDWRIYDITWQRDGKLKNEPKSLRALFGLKPPA